MSHLIKVYVMLCYMKVSIAWYLQFSIVSLWVEYAPNYRHVRQIIDTLVNTVWRQRTLRNIVYMTMTCVYRYIGYYYELNIL